VSERTDYLKSLKTYKAHEDLTAERAREWSRLLTITQMNPILASVLNQLAKALDARHK
jgi:hypothetical protein